MGKKFFYQFKVIGCPKFDMAKAKKEIAGLDLAQLREKYLELVEEKSRLNFAYDRLATRVGEFGSLAEAVLAEADEEYGVEHF